MAVAAAEMVIDVLEAMVAIVALAGMPVPVTSIPTSKPVVEFNPSMVVVLWVLP